MQCGGLTTDGGVVRDLENHGHLRPPMSTCSILHPHHDFFMTPIQSAIISSTSDTIFALINCSINSPVLNLSVVPNGVAYNTMIGGFCKIREIEMVVKFFKEMGLSGIESTCVAYENHITGDCKIGNLDSAMLLYKDMLRKDFKPEGSTMDVLIRGLCDESRVLEALNIMSVGIFD